MFNFRNNSGLFNYQLNQDIFFKNLLSFMNDSDDSLDSSGYASDTFSPDTVVTSGNFNSFSVKSDELINRRCRFGYRLYTSWTKSSVGLITSARESRSTNQISASLVKDLRSLKTTAINQDQKIPTCVTSTLTEADKALFFTKYLRNSLLREFENHPAKIRRITEDSEKNNAQTQPKQEKIVKSSSNLKHSKLGPNNYEGSSNLTYQPRVITKGADPITLKNNSNLLNASSINGKNALPSQPQNWRVCRFCLKNGEPEEVYAGHIIKAVDGSVTCPILRRYVCELCGATGSKSHTRKYCPLYMEATSVPDFRALASGILAMNLGHK